MQVRARWPAAAIFVLFACSTQSPRSKAEDTPSGDELVPAGGTPSVPRRTGRREALGNEAALAAAQPVALLPQPTEPPGSHNEIKLGMRRDALIKTLSYCSTRTLLIPPARGRLLTEVLQPKRTDPECIKRFGENRFMMLGGVLKEILPGLDEQAPNPEAHASSGGHGR